MKFTLPILSLLLATGADSEGQVFPSSAWLNDAVNSGGVTDYLEVQFRKSMTDKQIAKAVGNVEKKTGCRSGKRIFPEAGRTEEKHRAAGLHLFYQFDCAGVESMENEKINSSEKNGRKLYRGVGVENAIKNLETETVVKLADNDQYGIGHVIPKMTIVEVEASPNLRGLATIPQTTTPNDPRYAQQPHYDFIKLREAWTLTSAANAWPNAKDVVVQVLDTGKNPNHEDLKINEWTNPGEVCGNGEDDDGNGYVDDCHGYNHADDSGTDLQGGGDHGTHCTGTVAADSDNEKGVAGVCGGMDGIPGASIMTSVGFGATSTGGFDAALMYGADNGARISSNSWGYVNPLPPSSWQNSATRAAISYAVSAGVLVVFAAGNDNSDDTWYPAYDPMTVAVAASGTGSPPNTNYANAAGYTNYGSWINITAPGTYVYSTTSTSAESSYGYKSGTSMACPHIAGVLALGLTYNPGATNQKLLDCLYSTADPAIQKISAGDMGAGQVDVEAFLQCVTPPPTVSPAPTTSFAPTSSPTVSAAPTKACVDVEVRIKTDNYPGETSYVVKDMNDALRMSRSSFPAANTLYSDTGCLIPGDHTFTIEDAYGDGICCEYGEGYYEVVSGGETLIEGGEFTASETKQFTVPGDASSLPILIFAEGFESSLGYFKDGGDHVNRFTLNKKQRKRGTASLELRDGKGEASSATTDDLKIDFKDIIETSAKISVVFWFYPFSFEGAEDWFVEYTTDGSTWIKAAQFLRSDINSISGPLQRGFTNDYSQVVSVDLKDAINNSYPDLEGADEFKLRFKCNAGGEADKVYIDEVRVVSHK